MLDSLKLETEKLVRSWMQHEPTKLRNYLVAGVEDPRTNVQSILSRHFLVRSVFGEEFRALMDHEFRFAAVMNWIAALATNTDIEELGALHHALRHGSDNSEGLEIPRLILATFSSLPLSLGSSVIPNYVEAYLGRIGDDNSTFDNESLNTFQNLWRDLLGNVEAKQASCLRVFEPACGSANDYRFLDSFGIARFLDYCGLDLCPKNIENARALFPQVHFEEGNIFEIDAQDNAYDLSFVHDLFEHFTVDGLHAAVEELCRVTRFAICAGFFQMDEIPDHIVRPTDEYHWNLLSMDQIKKLFASYGFTGQIIRVKSFLHQEFGCDYTHNPNAYTFILRRA